MDFKDTNHFLSMALANGLEVDLNKGDLHRFSTGLVEFLNVEDNDLYAVGDQDGVLLSFKTDSPLLLVRFKPRLVYFRMLDGNDLDASVATQARKMILNVVGFCVHYFNEDGSKFTPAEKDKSGWEETKLPDPWWAIS